MTQNHFVKILGTVTSPSFNTHIDGAPSFNVKVKRGEEILAATGALTDGSTLPFSLLLDRATLVDATDLVLEAKCYVGIGEEAAAASAVYPLDVNELDQMAPLDLVLEPTGAAPLSQKLRIPPTVIPLSGVIQVPAELAPERALLTVTLLRVQEDGHSNRFDSSLGGLGISLTQQEVPFTIFLDANSFSATDTLKLAVILGGPEIPTPYAGRTVRDLDVFANPNLGEITLRPPRH